VACILYSNVALLPCLFGLKIGGHNFVRRITERISNSTSPILGSLSHSSQGLHDCLFYSEQ
jgi:hypothetical protein